MQKHRHKAHVCQTAVVHHALTPLRLHHIASIEAEAGVLIVFFQGFHQSCGMQIAAGLTRNQVVSHSASYHRL